MTSHASLALALLLTAAAPLQEEYTRDWRRLESEHFVMVGNASEGAMRRVGEQLEDFRAAVLALMPSYADVQETDTTVVVFRHDAAFGPFRPDNDVAGYFSSGPYRNYIALTGEREMQPIIYHEYVHQLTRRARDWPPWMREGAAEFYSTLEIRSNGEKIRLGTTIGHHLDWLDSTFIPLAEFLDPETRFDGDFRTRTLYAQGWALFHYMQFGRRGMAGQLDEFNRRLAESGNDVEASFEATFGIDLGAFQSDFLIYVRSSLTFPAIEATLPERLPEIELPDSVRIPESEASFYLGDLLLHLERHDNATSYLERALDLGGEFEPALTSLHLLHEELGDDALAGDYLERALRAPDAGYLPRLLAAQKGLGERPYQEVAAEAEAHLRRVIADRPDLPAGHFWLGQVLMRRPDTEARAEAVAALETAVGLSQGDPLMRLTHARALWASGDDLRAQGLLMGLVQSTREPVVLEEARLLQEEIVRVTAAREASAQPAAAPPPADGAAPVLRSRPAPASPPAPPRVPGIPQPVLPEGMLMAEGAITRIACLGQFEVFLSAGGETIRLVAPNLDGIVISSYSPSLRGEMPCDDFDPALPARVIYEPAANEAGFDGVPVRVDFLP